MTPIVFKFFFRRVVFSVAVIWIALTLLLMLIGTLRYIADYDIGRAILIGALQTPALSIEILIFACPIGAALAVKHAAATGELAVFRAAGLSPRRLMLMQAVIALFFSLLCAVINQTAFPFVGDTARALQNKAPTAHGLWLREGADFIRIGRLDDNRKVSDVLIYHTAENGLSGMTSAQRGDYAEGGWRLHRLTVIAHTPEGVRTQTIERQDWPLSVAPDSFSAFVQDPRDMSLWSATVAAFELDTFGEVRAELWESIIKRWLSFPALPLLAATSVFFIDHSRRRKGYGGAALWSLSVAALYYIVREMAVQIHLINDAIWILPIPLLALAALAAAALRRRAH